MMCAAIAPAPHAGEPIRRRRSLVRAVCRAGAALWTIVSAAGAPAAEVSAWFQAHRGGLDEVPENTLVALEHAWSVPGAVPEVDLRTTRDGGIVLMHDETPARTTNAAEPLASTPVNEMDLATIARLDAGIRFGARYAGAQVPTLAEVLRLLVQDSKRQIYLDLKDVDFDVVARRTIEAGAQQQVIFVHGNAATCARLQGLYAGARTMTWLSGTPEEIRERFDALAQLGFRGISQLQLHLRVREAGPPIQYVLDEAYLAECLTRCRVHGVELQLRPFRFDAFSLRRLLDLGVLWFVTDAPAAFGAALAQARALPAPAS